MISAFQSNAFQNNAFQISAATPDTHDGIFDAELYRKLQKKLKTRTLLDEDTERAQQLRETIETVIRDDDIPETVRTHAAQVIAETKRETAAIDFGPIASDLLALNLQLQATQRAMLEAAAAEWERQDEEDIELLLSGVL